MGSHHHEHTDDTYFLDQICMIALSGAFGVICLALYFVRQDMLTLLLGPQFHPFVLASGAVLVVIALVRASVLWSRAGASTQDHAHDAGHDHGHSHSHAEVGHAHSHSHGEHSHSHDESCGHDHGHSHDEIAHSHAFGHTPATDHAHAHSPSDSHGHSHADHDHSWAPWRYVVLLVPIILFLLGLPSKPPAIDAKQLPGINTGHDAEDLPFAGTLLAMGNDVWSALNLVAFRYRVEPGAAKAEYVNIKRLEDAAASKTDRDYWSGKWVKMRGQYFGQNERVFFLVRFRIQCCAADAIQISVPVVARDAFSPMTPNSWVEVVGRVDFRPDPKGALKTILVSSRNDVQKCNPDPNPYVTDY